MYRSYVVFFFSAFLAGAVYADGWVAGTPRPSLFSDVDAHQIAQHNPYCGHKRRCAAFARYGLYLMSGRHFTTFGSATQWSRHALQEYNAKVPLLFVQPGDLLFFSNQRNRINHVAIVLGTTFEGRDHYTIQFQDERGIHVWDFATSVTYLGMVPSHGVDPLKLDTIEMAQNFRAVRSTFKD